MTGPSEQNGALVAIDASTAVGSIEMDGDCPARRDRRPLFRLLACDVEAASRQSEWPNPFPRMGHLIIRIGERSERKGQEVITRHSLNLNIPPVVEVSAAGAQSVNYPGIEPPSAMEPDRHHPATPRVPPAEWTQEPLPPEFAQGGTGKAAAE
jgi:hypothetical protein